MSPLISLICFVKNHAGEGYLRDKLEPSQTSNMELFKKYLKNGVKPFVIFTKSSILDVRLSTEAVIRRCFATLLKRDSNTGMFL